MKYAIITLALFLAGCYQVVDRYDMDRAKVACGLNEVVEIRASLDSTEFVTCGNGKTYDLRGVPTK